MIVDLSKNPKQESFFNTVIESTHGLNDYRYLSYGGAIRGGKTFVSLASLAVNAKTFGGYRSHVIRADFPALQGTSIPSMQKIIGNSSSWGWNRDRANYFLYNKKSDGKIFFRGENKISDPELNDFLGMETNAILFEQIEEISQKTWDIGMSRIGSWYIDPMPKPIILATFNPTQKWIKKKVYEPFMKGELKAPYYFQLALPNDNAFVTQEQWNAWGNMADRYQSQFIKGDWTNFEDTNRWAWAFDKEKHVSTDLSNPIWNGNPDHYMYLSFDFNRNPITCSIIQHIDACIYVIEQIKLANSDIYQLCNRIKTLYPGFLYIVTGDATGQNKSAALKDNLTYYKIIQRELTLKDTQFKLRSVNPRLEDNQVLVNSILNKYKVQLHPVKAASLEFDFENVLMNPDGTIVKVDRTDPAQQADALDCFRYWCDAFMKHFIKQI